MFNRFIELSGKISSILLECPKSPMLSAFEVQSIKEFVNLLQRHDVERIRRYT